VREWSGLAVSRRQSSRKRFALAFRPDHGGRSFGPQRRVRSPIVEQPLATKAIVHGVHDAPVTGPTGPSLAGARGPPNTRTQERCRRRGRRGIASASDRANQERGEGPRDSHGATKSDQKRQAGSTSGRPTRAARPAARVAVRGAARYERPGRSCGAAHFASRVAAQVRQPVVSC